MKLGGFSVTLGAVAALALLVAGASGTYAGATPDVDGDGIKNLVDNCVDVANGLNVQGVQGDFDLDGFGDQCDGDLNNSGETNVTDFILFSNTFNKDCNYDASTNDCTEINYNPLGDMNASGEVNVTDFIFFSGNFAVGEPGPSGLLCAVNTSTPEPRATRNAGSLSGKNVCEFLGTYSTKCNATINGDARIRSTANGQPLRFIINKKERPLVAGHPGGHCVWGV